MQQPFFDLGNVYNASIDLNTPKFVVFSIRSRYGNILDKGLRTEGG